MRTKILSITTIIFLFISVSSAMSLKFGVSGSRNWLEADRKGDGYGLHGFGGIGFTPQFYLLYQQSYGAFYPAKDTMEAVINASTLNLRYYFRDPECERCSSPFLEIGGGPLTTEISPKTRFPNDPFDNYIIFAGLGMDYQLSDHFSITMMAKYNYTSTEYLDGVAAGEVNDGFYELNLGINLKFFSIFKRRSDLDKLYNVHNSWPPKTYPKDNVVLNSDEGQKKGTDEDLSRIEKRLAELEKRNRELEKKLSQTGRDKPDTVHVKTTRVSTPDTATEESARASRMVDVSTDSADLFQPEEDPYCEPCNDDNRQTTKEIDDPELKSKIEDFIISWKNAWENQNLDKYISFYAPFFKHKDMTLRDYYSDKKDVFEKTDRITIKIDKIQIIDTLDTSVLVKFLQHYKADNYSDFGVKKLLIDTEDAYMILNETWTAIGKPSFSSEQVTQRRNTTPQQPEIRQSSQTSEKYYTIQIFSSTDYDKTLSEINRIKARDINVYLQKREINNQLYYRVRYGRYENFRAAKKDLLKLLEMLPQRKDMWITKTGG
ncbi:MAG: SPOR domain-containing protein [Fidelibacterota bacterium]